jgi:hypothetical protein
MPTLRTIHDPCGEIEMDTIDVVLFVAPDGTGTYRFECPNCYLMVKKLADQRIVSLLRAAEVRLVEVSPPGEESGPGGPRLTTDDLIDFHMLLQTDGWFEALKREVGP